MTRSSGWTALTLAVAMATGCHGTGGGGTLTQERWVAVGFEGELTMLFSPCTDRGSSAALKPSSSGASSYEAVAPGIVRLGCGKDLEEVLVVHIEPAVRLEVKAPATMVVGERASYRVVGVDAAGHALDLGGRNFSELEGTVEQAHPRGCMDISAGGQSIDAVSPGLGRVRARFGALAGVAEIQTLPATTPAPRASP